MHDTETELVLANRHFLYTLLGRVFGDEPTAALLELLAAPHANEELSCAAERDSEVRMAVAALDLPVSGDAQALEQLRGEYTRLFIGPAKPPVDLWESLYVNGEPLLFQESTLAVRQAYRACGYLPAGYPHVADDHIAIELNFLAALAGSMCAATEATEAAEGEDQPLSGSVQEASALRAALGEGASQASQGYGAAEGALASCDDVLAAHAAFLDEHLLRWLHDFAAGMEALPNGSGFYPRMARLAAAFAASDRRWIGQRGTCS